ncbi:MAG: iron ABC transporter permease [Thaumarchaeota archaeon]|nr:iron ABC transporter permease [Nitrososphaerota archaeon]
MLIYGSLRASSPLDPRGDPRITADNYIRVFTDPTTLSLLQNTLVYAVASTLTSLLVGTSLAWLFARTNVGFKRFFEIIIIVPIMIPPLVAAFSWIFLLSPNVGIINHTLRFVLGLKEAPLDIFSIWGMVWVSGLYGASSTFLLTSVAFNAMDPSLEEAAKISGSGVVSAAARVTFPMMAPAILSAAVLQFVQSAEAFDVPAILGAPRFLVYSTAIRFALEGKTTPDYGQATAYAINLLIITIVGIFIYQRLTSSSRKFATVTGKGYRPGLIDLHRWKYVVMVVIICYLTLTVVLPLALVLFASLLPYYDGVNVEALSRISLDRYAALLVYPNFDRALRNTLFLAFSVATVTAILSAVIAYIAVKTKIRGRGAIEGLATAPVAFPAVVFGLALVWTYLTFKVGIYGTIWILFIAYVTRFLPYGVRFTSSNMIQLHSDLEEAARTSGGSFAQVFLRVIFPLTILGFIAGWFYVFIHSTRELGASLFLMTHGNEVLSTVLFDFWSFGRLTDVAALSALLIFIGVIPFIFLRFAGRRFGRLT